MDGPDIALATGLRAWLVSSVDGWIAGAPGRSLRRFSAASQIPLGTLSHVMKGSRALPAEHEPGLAKALELDGDEASVLSVLAALARYGHDPELWLRLRGRQEMLKARRLGSSDATYVGDWTTVAVREMSAMEGFQADAAWIRSRLRPSPAAGAVEASLDVLREVHPRVADPSVVLSTGMEPTMQPAAGLQHQIVEVAATRIQELAREERYVQAYIAAVPASAIPKLRALLDDLIVKAVAICKDEDGGKSELVQVSAQVIPLTLLGPEEG